MKLRKILAGAAAAAGILVVAALLTSSIRSLLAYPLTYIAWLLNEVYSYTPSWLIWGVLLLALLILAAESLVKPFQFSEAEDEKRANRVHRRVTLLVHWLNQRGRSFYRHQINHELTELAARILAEQRRTSVQEIRSAIRSQQLDLPPGLNAYFEQGLAMWGNPEKQRSPLQLLFINRKDFISEKDDTDIENALAYLEDLMEVSHDPGYFNRSSN